MIVDEAAGRCFRSAIYYSVGGAEVQTASVLVGMSLDVTTSIRLRCEAVVGIVGFHHRGVIRIGLGYLKACCGMECPSGLVIIRSHGGIGADNLCTGSEGAQGGHVTHVVITEASGLQGCTPFGDFTATEIIFITGGIAQGIRYHGGEVVSSVIDRSSHRTGSIGHTNGAPCKVGACGGGIVAAICIYQHHAGGGVSA